MRLALLEIAGKGDTISASSVGKYLSKKRDRVVGDYRLEADGEYGTRSLWKVRLAACAPYAACFSQRAEFVNSENIIVYKDDKKSIEAGTSCTTCTTCKDERDGVVGDNSTNLTHSDLEGTQLISDDEAYWESLLTADVPANPKVYCGSSAYGSQTRTNQLNPIIPNCQACRHYSTLARSCGDNGYYVGNTDDPFCGGTQFQPLSVADDEERV